MTAIKKAWVFIKSYWYIPIFMLLGVFLVSKRDRVKDIIDSAEESRVKQINAINAAENKKQIQKKKIQAEYDEAVEAVTAMYKLQKKTLDIEKINKIEKIAKEYYNDKEKISQEIWNEFGFTYTPSKNNNNS
jgi:hydroxypyruvate isomerase|tara:strand:- start:144 stop:539 length:396 start_codon:yes stop_codon:yes gene_type:complete